MLSEAIVRVALSTEDDAERGKLAAEVLAACTANDVDQLNSLVAQGADTRSQDDDTGASSLMVAARQGHVPIVRRLLELGVPWNAQDKEEMCAGDYARSMEEEEVLFLVDVAHAAYWPERNACSHLGVPPAWAQRHVLSVTSQHVFRIQRNFRICMCKLSGLSQISAAEHLVAHAPIRGNLNVAKATHCTMAIHVTLSFASRFRVHSCWHPGSSQQ